MNKIIELREKQAKVWEEAKAFLDERRGEDGLLSAEDTATYEKMETEVVKLGRRLSAWAPGGYDLELAKATSQAQDHPGESRKRGGILVICPAFGTICATGVVMRCETLNHQYDSKGTWSRMSLTHLGRSFGRRKRHAPAG